MDETILQNIARFTVLTEEEKSFFLSLLQYKKIRKRQYLVQAGEICRYECFVSKGCLRQYYVDDAGHEHVMMFAIEGWWTSDMYSFVSGEPSLTNIEALEDSELVLIERSQFEILLQKLPKFERHFRIMLQRAFVTHQRRLIENMSLPADQRYCKFIERYPEMEQRIPLKQIASYLGITPESLSRIRSNYQKK